MSKIRSKQKALIFLCWLIYTLAQLGRYSYTSNLNPIMEKYGVGHSQAGLPTTLFFFSYGAGQIVNGLFCKKYNKKWSLSSVLFLSGAINVALYIGVPFSLIKYLWFFNGLLQSALWASLILVLSENLKSDMLSKASFFMSTASLGGTFISYGLSSLFSLGNMFEFAFMLSGAALVAVACVWFICFDKVVEVTAGTVNDEAEIKREKNAASQSLACAVVILALFVAIGNAISGGLKTWFPSILKETYGLSDSLSVFLSVFLPFCGLFGSFLAELMYRLTNDFVILNGILFLAAAVLIFAVILSINLSWIVMLVLFVSVTVSMSAVVNAITSRFPLYMRDKGNSGFFAGFFNGCCYIGTAGSTYGLGVIADESGWISAFELFLVLSLLSVVIAFVYFVVVQIRKRAVKR